MAMMKDWIITARAEHSTLFLRVDLEQYGRSSWTLNSERASSFPSKDVAEQFAAEHLNEAVGVERL